VLKKPGDKGEHILRPGGISCQDVLTIAPNQTCDNRNGIVPVHELALPR
jgi:hypothetical protein